MRDGESQKTKGQPGITQAALFGLCPRCGAKGLWDGLANLAERCGDCGLEIARHEPRGRSLYLIVLPVTILLILAALKLDEWIRLPVGALMPLWGLLVPVAVIGALRLTKAAALKARLEKEELL